jgi:hypothetical protein
LVAAMVELVFIGMKLDELGKSPNLCNVIHGDFNMDEWNFCVQGLNLCFYEKIWPYRA